MSSIKEVITVQLDDNEKDLQQVPADQPVTDPLSVKVGINADENEITPEFPKMVNCMKSISPTSAAVMQSLFYKEMVADRELTEDSSSLDSDSSTTSEVKCTCGNKCDVSTEESGLDSLHSTPIKKPFKSFDLHAIVDEEEENKIDGDEQQENQETLEEVSVNEETAKNTDDKIDDFVEEKEEDVPKEDVIVEIIQTLAPQYVNQVSEVEIHDTPHENLADKKDEVSEDNESTDEDVEAVFVPHNSPAPIQVGGKELSQFIIVNDEIDLQSATEPSSTVVMVVGEKKAPQSKEIEQLDTPVQKLTPQEMQANALAVTPGLAPLLDNDKWLYNQPNTSVRDALANVGICATQLLREALNANPKLFHWRNEDSWFGKNKMVLKGIAAVLARVGIVDESSRSYKVAFNSLQNFSGTYIFLRHCLDHGNFAAHQNLYNLQKKAELLKARHHQNTEIGRCKNMKRHLLSPPVCAIEPSNVFNIKIGTSSTHQPSPVPLSPRVLNGNFQQVQQMSPRKRAASKENSGEGENSPVKKFIYDESSVAAMNLAFFGLHRM